MSVYDVGTEETHKVEAWRDSGSKFIAVPRNYALSLPGFSRRAVEKTADYARAPRYPLPTLREHQGPWVDDVLKSLSKGGDLIAQADTGKGKTVMSVYVACKKRARTVILVDQELLWDQWYACLTNIFKVPASDIGTIRGGTMDVDGKSFVLAMVQTLYRRKLPEWVSQYFELVIYDECHVIGAPQFSNVLYAFQPRYRLAVSATPDRKDALGKILYMHLGAVGVEMRSKHAKSRVRYLDSTGVYSWYANVSPKTGRFISEIAADGKRNYLICKAIEALYKKGRHILVIGDRIEHLENLRACCEFLGIPSDAMGVASGYYNTWGYAKDPRPKRRPLHLAKGAEYTPVKMQLVSKRTPKKVITDVKRNAQVLFATYSIFSKGVDEDRLNAGIDCTPRSSAKQVHGRILRTREGKVMPVWVTIRDVNSYRSLYMFSKRIAEYVQSNAEIFKWSLGRGLLKEDVKRLLSEVSERVRLLKDAKILLNKRGSNTVQMRSSVSAPKRTRAAATGSR